MTLVRQGFWVGWEIHPFANSAGSTNKVLQCGRGSFTACHACTKVTTVCGVRIE